MLSILWVEDDVNDARRALDLCRGVPSLDVKCLLLGDSVDDRGFICPEGSDYSLDEAYRHLLESYRRFRPWLLVMDLKLDCVRASDEARLGWLSAPGVVLSQRLAKDVGISRMLWVSRYGEAIVDAILPEVIGVWRNDRPVRKVGYPLTYILSKETLESCGVELLSELADKALDPLRLQGLDAWISPQVVADLFRLLHGRGASLRHYLTEAADFHAAIAELAAFELIPLHDPPVSLRDWLLISGLDLNAWKDFDDELVGALECALGIGIWGMPLKELESMAIGCSSAPLDICAMPTVDPEERVVGPVCRQTVRAMLQCALSNAQRSAAPGTSVSITAWRQRACVYVFIANQVKDGDAAYSEIKRRSRNGSLRGIGTIKDCCRDLNHLHQAWRGWGFAMIRGGPSEILENELDDKSRLELMEALPQFSENWGPNTFVAAFRIPLVSTRDLANLARLSQV